MLGRDQYGNTFSIPGIHPRKELMEKLGYKKAQKMYADKEDGSTVHIGYVIGPHWVSLYAAFEKKD